jgi:uncharacterized protein (TIGR02246 family)
MKTGRRLALVLGLAALVAIGGHVATGYLPAGADQPEGKEGDPAQPGKERREEFIKAFNKGDAKAVAAFWTEDAKYVDSDGKECKGRQAIEKLYEKSFAARKGAKLVIHVTGSKMVTPDVMLNDGVTEVTPANGDPGTTTRFSAVLVKKDGTWYLQSVHDSDVTPPSNAEHLDALDWLIGSWKGESDKGESGNASFNWTDNENFIISEFDTTLNGIPVYGGTQWIGWDAVDKHIRSWSFYSGGGFGEAVWTKDANKWSVKTTARTADGRKVSATNIVTKTDNDHMTWQMTQLMVDGKSMPDSSPIKLKRTKPAEE